jgi:hypothetical protein
VPLNPNPLTPAIRLRPDGCHGVVSVATRTGIRAQGMCGLGVSKCRCGGIAFARIARMTLMTLVTPAAVARCPVLVFTEPISNGSSAGRFFPSAAASAWTSIGSPNGVPDP